MSAASNPEPKDASALGLLPVPRPDLPARLTTWPGGNLSLERR